MAFLIINGKKHEIQQEDLDLPLLWFLRDNLSLTGTKYSCGSGICGTCTVLINGAPSRSCLLSLKELLGKEVTTIESKDDSPLINLIIKAWSENDVAQCGYCQPGQVMNLAGILNTSSSIEEKDVIEQMSSNYCRCKSYPKMKQAVRQVLREVK